MRLIAALAATTLLTIPAATPSQAHHGKAGKHVTVTADMYAAAKKNKAKKPRAKKEEYLRAVPSR